MNIHEATASYEAWLRERVSVHDADIRYKHRAMRRDPFLFFRGTYYRWLQHWPTTCAELLAAPQVLGVGDLHVENYGTWRDAEGRLVWGINDFDEVAELPYTNDLVRLATSIRLAKQSEAVQLGFGKACKAILRGYHRTLVLGGTPFVLEERHRHLRRLATNSERAPFRFWDKLTTLLKATSPVLPPVDVLMGFAPTWPSDTLKPEYRYREQVGVGSLGKPRYVALVQWNGSWLAREAKALTPPANEWHTQQPHPLRIHELLQQAVRCHDPFYHVHGSWIIRRLAARCSRIDLAQLQATQDETALFTAMGVETANIHLASKNADIIVSDLESRPASWLADAGRAMAKVLKADWQAWREQMAKG